MRKIFCGKNSFRRNFSRLNFTQKRGVGRIFWHDFKNGYKLNRFDLRLISCHNIRNVRNNFYLLKALMLLLTSN